MFNVHCSCSKGTAVESASRYCLTSFTASRSWIWVLTLKKLNILVHMRLETNNANTLTYAYDDGIKRILCAFMCGFGKDYEALVKIICCLHHSCCCCMLIRKSLVCLMLMHNASVRTICAYLSNPLHIDVCELCAFSQFRALRIIRIAQTTNELCRIGFIAN